jgi:hypothetical protein
MRSPLKDVKDSRQFPRESFREASIAGAEFLSSFLRVGDLEQPATSGKPGSISHASFTDRLPKPPRA